MKKAGGNPGFFIIETKEERWKRGNVVWVF